MGRFAGKDILARSRKFALKIINLFRTIPDDFVSRHLLQQLVRCATSIGANLCEADMADTIKDFCNKVNISQKEAHELQKICRQIVKASRPVRA